MKSTKKSLIASALSLVLCVSMLLGTTYAWFTDSVTSGKNKIVAGNLDVELTHTNAKVENQKVQDATDLFGVALWEPGVIAWENLTVTNVGNLALKYALNLNVFDKNATTAGNDLTEVIKVAVIDGGFTATGDPVADRASAQAITTYESLKDFQKTGNLEGGDSTGDTFGVVLYWQPTDNDNLYNLKNGLTSTDGQPLFVEFGVNLVATQDTVEKDSFDNQYDVSAELPVIASFPNIKKADVTDASKSLKINKQGTLESAEVKATGAKTVFESLEDKTEGRTNDMTLTLSVNETGSKEKEVEGGKEKTLNFDINMSAIMKVTNTSTGALIDTKKNDNVEKLDEFTTIKLKIGKYSSVSVLHKSVAMEKLASATAIPTDTVNGGYFYDGEEFVYVVTKTFSPFTFKCVTEKPIVYYRNAKAGEKDVKIVSFAGKEWVLLNESTGLMLMTEEIGSCEFKPAVKPLTDDAYDDISYNGSTVDSKMNEYFNGLSESDKGLIVETTLHEAGIQPPEDNYVEVTEAPYNTAFKRYAFALGVEEAREFGLQNLTKSGILTFNYNMFGYMASYFREFYMEKGGQSYNLICFYSEGADEINAVTVMYGQVGYPMGVRPAMRLNLSEINLKLAVD